jgi:hypothetical protein
VSTAATAGAAHLTIPLMDDDPAQNGQQTETWKAHAILAAWLGRLAVLGYAELARTYFAGAGVRAHHKTHLRTATVDHLLDLSLTISAPNALAT